MFTSPIQLVIGGSPAQTVNAPWVTSLGAAGKTIVAVLTADQGRHFAAGVYVNVDGGLWRLAISGTDFNALLANGNTFSVYINLVTPVAVPAANAVFANGTRQSTLTVAADTRIWATAQSLVAGTGDGVSFQGKFLGSAVPTVGPVPSWSVNTGATGIPTIVDYRGAIKYCKIAEARFWGARRVENLLRASNAFDNATYWTAIGAPTLAQITTDALDTLDTDGISYKTAYSLTGDGTTSVGVYQILGVLPAGKFTFSIEVKAGTVGVGIGVQLYVSGGSVAKAITYTPGATDGWVRIAGTGTADGVSSYRLLIRTTAVGAIKIRKAQVEDKTTEVDDANGNRPPFEYVSQDEIIYPTGVPTPYHGAFVDGVHSNFLTYPANTVNNVTNVVTEAVGAPLPESQLLGLWIEEQETNLCTNGDTLTGWSINGTTSLSITTGQPSPDGRNNGILLTEDSAFTSKFVYLTGTFADNSQACAFTVFDRFGPNPQQFGRIDIKRKDGTTVVASFDLLNGVLGNEATVLAASARAYMVQLGTSGRWLCALSANVLTGGSTPECHFGLMATATGTTYTGTAKTLRMWNPQFIAKEHPCTPIAAGATTRTRTGYAIEFSMNRVIGKNNFAVYLEMHPMYDTGAANKTIDGVNPSWYYPYYMRAAVPNQAHYRLGQSLRYFADGVTGYALFAQDRYNGNVVQDYKWKPNTFYAKGSWVVPLATKVDNANPAQKQFYNFVDGVSGASEPNWNTTWVTPPDGGVSNITPDGDCRWQANHQNRISGNFENYDGFLTLTRSGFMQTCRIVNWFSGTPADMGSAINGVVGYRQTEPFPINRMNIDGSLIVQMDHMRLGRSSTTYPVSSQGFRFVTIWDNPPNNNVGTWAQLSATGSFA